MNKQVLHNAIVRIKRGIEMAIKAGDEKAVEELTVTLEALEKQVRKKSIEDYGMNECRCPACGEVFGYAEPDEEGEYYNEKLPYCWNCGKAIDWSVRE